MDSDKLLVVCTNSAGDRKLYSILRNAEGQVWDWKHDRFVDFVDENYLDYVVSVSYKGGDVYLFDQIGERVKYVDVSKRDFIAKYVFVYIQGGREPSIYDKIYHVFGAEMPKEIPKKIRPMAPAAREPVSRPRSKVKKDYYSKE